MSSFNIEQPPHLLPLMYIWAYTSYNASLGTNTNDSQCVGIILLIIIMNMKVYAGVYVNWDFSSLAFPCLAVYKKSIKVNFNFIKMSKR